MNTRGELDDFRNYTKRGVQASTSFVESHRRRGPAATDAGIENEPQQKMPCVDVVSKSEESTHFSTINSEARRSHTGEAKIPREPPSCSELVFTYQFERKPCEGIWVD